MTLSHINSFHCFAQSADLVNFDQNRVSNAFFKAHSQTFRVCNKQIIANQLDSVTQSNCQQFPAFEIIFSHTVFNREDWEFVAQTFVVFNHLSVGIGFAFALHFIFAVFIKFRRSSINSQNNIFTWFVTSVFDGVYNKGQSFVSGLQIRSKTAFIANVCVLTGSFQVFLQSLENFGTHTDSFFNRICRNRHNHKFLNINRVICVFAAVQNVHHWNWQSASHSAAQVTIQRQASFFCLSFSHSQRYCQNSVSAQVAFVFCAVQINHCVINVNLIFCFIASQSVINFVVYIFNSFQNTFAAKAGFVTVTQFYSFVYACRST